MQESYVLSLAMMKIIFKSENWPSGPVEGYENLKNLQRDTQTDGRIDSRQRT